MNFANLTGKCWQTEIFFNLMSLLQATVWDGYREHGVGFILPSFLDLFSFFFLNVSLSTLLHRIHTGFFERFECIN